MKKILLALMPLFWPKMPPLGIAYLASFAASKGISVDILDLNNTFFNLAQEELKKRWLISCLPQLEENILNIIRSEHPQEYKDALRKMMEYDVVGFSCFKSNLKTTLETAKILKARKGRIKVIMGGPEVTRQFFKTKGNFNAELKSLANLIVVGEGERPFVDYVKEKKVKVEVKVVTFLELDNLDEVNFPGYGGFDLSKYPRPDSVPVLFSRGCPRRCRFCSEKLLYKKFRVRSVKDIIEEIRLYKENEGIEYFVFHDSMMNADAGRLEGLCDAIIENFGSIRWEAQMAVRGDMDEAIFQKMKRSGCYHLFIGLESGCDETLKNMNKGYTCGDALEFFQKLKNANLSFGVSMIVGFPQESEANFNESLDFITSNKELIGKVEQVNPFVYYDGTDVDMRPLPGSEPARRLEVFIKTMREHNIKYTNAFVGNLLEKNG